MFVKELIRTIRRIQRLGGELLEFADNVQQKRHLLLSSLSLLPKAFQLSFGILQSS